MSDEAVLRTRLGTARRVVIKIGSSAITSLGPGVRHDRLEFLADAAQARMRAGSDVFIVSSGAVGAGMAPLGMRRRPQDIAAKQAVASVGQAELVGAWGRAFARHNRHTGLVLLTATDISRRDSARNAQRTLDKMRTLGVVPIINENDAVSTYEFHFGDNDRLAALVAHLISADALILLSDVDAMYDRNPAEAGAQRITYVPQHDALDGVQAGTGGALGTGGMASKLAAARLAADAGVPVLLTAADLADQALRPGFTGGTVFEPRAERMSARHFWMRHAADAHGYVVLDDGAVAAISRPGPGGRRRSLLSAGVIDVGRGFFKGEVIELRDTRGTVVARGIAGYDATEVREHITRRHSADPQDTPDSPLIEERSDGRPLGRALGRPLVHADDLVTLT